MFLIVDVDSAFFSSKLWLILLKIAFKKSFFGALKLIFCYFLFEKMYFMNSLFYYLDFLNFDSFVNSNVLQYIELKDARIFLRSDYSAFINDKILQHFSFFEGVIMGNVLTFIDFYKQDNDMFYISNNFTKDIIDSVDYVGLINPSYDFLTYIKSIKKEYVVFYV